MTTREKPRILVADDEVKYTRALKAILDVKGYETVIVHDGLAAVEAAATEEPDLVLLDVRMPKLSGYEVCRRIREFSLTPIIMLTALADKSDIVQGLEAGADDYVTKPFSTKELLARVYSSLRRASYNEPISSQPSVQAGDLKIDYTHRRVYLADREVHLTPTEYKLLCTFTQAIGSILSSEFILEKVWGSEYDDPHENLLVPRVIHRLRNKIESDPGNPRYIHTRPGLGYIFLVPNEDSI